MMKVTVLISTVIGEMSLDLEVVGHVDVPKEARCQFFLCERNGKDRLLLHEAALEAGFPQEIVTQEPLDVNKDDVYVIYVREDGLIYCCNFDVVDDLVLKTWYPSASDLDDLTDDQESEHIDRMLLLIKS